MKFCHIYPTDYLKYLGRLGTPPFVPEYNSCLMLAHLVNEDAEYAKYYKGFHSASGNKSEARILDNSAFEMYKRGLPMMSLNQVMTAAHEVRPTHVVLPDYPSKPPRETIDAAVRAAPIYRANGFGTFFVPQSEIGDLEGYISCFAWAATSPYVDYIGVSILGVPNAFGVEKGNRLQRFLSRWRMMSILKERGLLSMATMEGKKIHFLGMVDGPNEISLMHDFRIDTWDSSAAVWAGINNKTFDTSPTGLIDGKLESEVLFDVKVNDNVFLPIEKNIEYIQRLVDKYNNARKKG